MSVNLSESPVLDEGEPVGLPEAWQDADAEGGDISISVSAKDRRNKYLARRHIERYLELKALRSHLDDYDAVDPEF